MKFNRWFINLLNDFLSSTTGLYLALILPIVVIFMPNSIKTVENIISSNWIQLWALFLLAVIAKNGQDQQQKNHDEHIKHLKKVHKHLGIK